jgi:uncharacterized 2Fe-2S/4Fe-4S cluster protein (DUF4445 family)
MDLDEDKGWIRVVAPELTTPSLKDNTGDVDRLLKGIQRELPDCRILPNLDLIKRAPAILRKYRYKVDALLYNSDGWILFDLFPHGREKPSYGLAVDLGTSTLVARLVNIDSGEVEDEASFLNPQTEIGPDVLTRIHYADREGGLAELRQLVIDRLNGEIGLLSGKRGLSAQDMVGMTVAGNTTMTHLFLGLDPHWICREPYIPVINKPPLFRAEDMGIKIHPEAPVLVFPNVGSYFGGDLIAGILASGMAEMEEVSLLVDVGTNAEIVLGNRDWLVACAGAAGPALEGGVATMGMMAGPGVIDKVSIDPASGEIRVRTIQNMAPVGICGSGLIDLVAQLFTAGMIDVRGKFVRRKCGKKLREIDGIQHYVVVPSEDTALDKDLTLAQTDLDALLRSKAAMYTILTTITGTVNVSMRDIHNFFIAGTFGSYIDPRSAIALGMVPDLPLEIYKSLGNTSLAGATTVLLSDRARGTIYGIRDRITYLELNVNQEFMNLFSASRFIPHTDASLFPSVRPTR